MTYDFYGNVQKETDYKTLLNAIKSIKHNGEQVFVNEQGMKNYTEQWISKLESLDNKKIFTEIQNKRNQFYFENGYKPELFYSEITLFGFSFSLNIDVEKILDHMNKHKEKINDSYTQKLNLNDLEGQGILQLNLRQVWKM